MSRNLKDIVDEGLAQLQSLSEKRKEIVGRCGMVSEDTTKRQDAAVAQLKQVEQRFTSEVHERSKQSEEYLNQLLAQIAEDNERFLASLQKNLQLRVSKITDDISHDRKTSLSKAIEKLDSLVKPLERELAAGSAEVRCQAERFLSSLETACDSRKIELLESQTTISAKISNYEQELTTELNDTHESISKSLADNRAERAKNADKLKEKMSKSIDKLEKDMDKQLSHAIDDAFRGLKELITSVESSMKQSTDSTYDEAVADLNSRNEESKTELSDSHDFGKQEIAERMEELTKSTDELSNELKTFLTNADADMRAHAGKRADRIKMAILFGGDPDEEDLVNRNPLAALPEELHELARSFKDELQQILQAHAEKLAALCSENESNWKNLSENFSQQVQQKLQEEADTWADRENKLNSQIESLEQRALDLCADLAAAADAAEGES